MNVKTFAISGPTGAGKSTLSLRLSTLSGLDVVGEPVPTKIPANRGGESAGYILERHFILERTARARDARQSVIAFDRTVQEDRAVFLRLHRTLGSITAEEERNLDAMADDAEQQIGQLDGVVYLDAPVETLVRRMRNDGRPQWLIDSIGLQLDLYEQWIASLHCEVMCLDTTQLAPEEVFMATSHFMRRLTRQDHE